MTLAVGLAGTTGRMGKTLLHVLSVDADTQLGTALIREDQRREALDLGILEEQLTHNPANLMAASEVVIDFSRPALTLELAKQGVAHKTPLVTGTTGFTNEEMAQLKRYAEQTPILWAANMSIGVNLLLALARQTAAALDDSYDIEVLEMHHNQKQDAPSGTALALGEAAAAGRNVSLADKACRARDGITGARPRGEIGFATLRGGSVVGDHTVIFASEGERIELSHKASDRAIYAAGAIKAARWLTGQKPGLYSMQDMLNV